MHVTSSARAAATPSTSAGSERCSGAREFGIGGDDRIGLRFGVHVELEVGDDVADRPSRRTGLRGSGELAFAPQAQVFFGDREAVGRAGQDLQALDVPGVVRRDQDAERTLDAAADPSAQLVQLGEPVAMRVEDHHHAGVGNVDADFDDRRRDEHVDFAAR